LHLETMSLKYDSIIIGLGAMGSSILYHLAKKSHKILGIDQFSIGHSYGSSHGLTRIIRLSYFENPAYVAMLKRAFFLWSKLEQESNEKLFTRTGSLDVGLANSKIYQGSKLACQTEKLEHELLSSYELKERFPGWKSIPIELHAVYQPDGGILFPEKCNQTHVKQALKLGAHVRQEEKVVNIRIYGPNEVIVETDKNEYLSKHIVLTCGPWLAGFIRQTQSFNSSNALNMVTKLLKPQRNVVIWYRSIKPDNYHTHNFPVYCLDYKNSFYYGFPITNTGQFDFEIDGFKIGKYHHLRENLTYEQLDKNSLWRTKFTLEDEQDMNETVKSLFKDGYGPIAHKVACIFTNTPDEHFILDPCPDPKLPCISLVSACSGHGFKFSSVIGELMSDLITERKAIIDTEWLKLKRFY
jgi:sarcosine oxidase